MPGESAGPLVRFIRPAVKPWSLNTGAPVSTTV